MLPSKVKDEKELESEGIFTCTEPEDSNSHGIILREATKGESNLSERKGRTDSDDSEE